MTKPPTYTQADVDRIMEETRLAASANTLMIANATLLHAKKIGEVPADCPFVFNVQPRKIVDIMNRMALDGLRYRMLMPLYLSLQGSSPTPDAISKVEATLDLMIQLES